MPQPSEVHRKFKEVRDAGLFDIPGSRIAFAGNPDTPRIWFLVCAAELNRFFITLEQKYEFDGNKFKVDDNGEIIPLTRKQQDLPKFDPTKFQPERGARF